MCLLLFHLFFRFSTPLILIKASELNTNGVSLQKNRWKADWPTVILTRLCHVGLSASMQGWCFTTRLLAPTTPSLSPMPSGSAGKCQLRWPHQPSCGRRIMTASPAVQPAGWTIRQSGEMLSSILLLAFARLCSAQHFKRLLIRSVQGNCSCLAISEDSCCPEGYFLIAWKIDFLI